MSRMDYLGTYAEGWTKGHAAMILATTADSYVFDDPNAGQIKKAEFIAYFSNLAALVRDLRGGESEGSFMELTEVVTKDDEQVRETTAWCWWRIPGTELQGGGLIKIGYEGVRSERIAYYTALPA